MKAQDVEAAFALARSEPQAAQWSLQDCSQAVAGELFSWVAEEDGRIAAFLIARRAADELEILNLVVSQELRRRGIAQSLLDRAMEEARNGGSRSVHLEVRISNAGAIKFYESLGFKCTGTRRQYYADPPEDALLMSIALK